MTEPTEKISAPAAESIAPPPAPLPAPSATSAPVRKELAQAKPDDDSAAGGGAPLIVKDEEYIERDRQYQTYTPNDLPLTAIMEHWRAIKPMSATAERKRKLLLKSLELFKPEQMFHMSTSDFRRKYVEFGNGPDYIHVLVDMNKEKLAVFAKYDGTFIHEPSIERMGLTKCEVWLTAEGVELWAKAMVDRHREKIRANPKLSGLLTQFLVELTNEPISKANRKA